MDINQSLKEAHNIEQFLPEFNGRLAALMTNVKLVSTGEGREVSRILLDAENLLKGATEIANFRKSGVEFDGFKDALSDLLRLFSDVQSRCTAHLQGRVQQIKAHASVSAMRVALSVGGVLDITEEYRLINAYPEKKENDTVKKVVETGTISGNVCCFVATAQENTAPAGSVVLPAGMSFELKKGDIINLHTHGMSSKEGLIEEKENKTVIMQAVDETVKVTGPIVWSPSALNVDLTALLDHKEKHKKCEQYSRSLQEDLFISTIFFGLLAFVFFARVINSSIENNEISTYVYGLLSIITSLLIIGGLPGRLYYKINARKAKKILNGIKNLKADYNVDCSSQEKECLDSIKEVKTSIAKILNKQKTQFDSNSINVFPVVPLLYVLPARFALSAGGEGLRVMEPLLAIEDKSQPHIHMNESRGINHGHQRTVKRVSSHRAVIA